MSVRAKVEAIIYATEEPVTLTQLATLLKDDVLAEARASEFAHLELNETVSDGRPSSEGAESSRGPDQSALRQQPAAAARSGSASQVPSAGELSVEEKKAREKQELSEVKSRVR